MAHFTTAGKHYADGVVVPEFSPLDLMITTSGGSSSATVMQPAPRHIMHDGQTYDFLFWDTGRRLTNIPTVRWTFTNASNWATWNAAAWYGVPGGGPGHPAEEFDALWVGNGPLTPTPIDTTGSTFVDGPGAGDVAYPGDGNDHEVRTEWGSDTVEALATLRRSADDPVLSFSGIERIVWGGAPGDSIFDENDADVPSGTSTVYGIANTTSRTLTLNAGDSGLAMVGYVVPVPSRPNLSFVEQLVDIIRDIHLIDPVGDPSPEDRVRLKLVAEALDLVAGERVTGIDAFAGLVDAAQKMDRVQLAQTITSTKATLARGEAALRSLEALTRQVEKPVG